MFTEQQFDEKKLDQKEIIETVQNSPTQALLYVQQNMAKLLEKVLSYKGSKKQLQLVLASCIQAPFNERPFRFGYKDQEELFNEFYMMQNAKVILLNASLEEMKQSEAIKSNNKPTEEVKKEEETNGTTKEEV